MSIKTLRKRIALVAVSALGVGLLSVAPASAAVSAIVPTTIDWTATTSVGICAANTNDTDSSGTNDATENAAQAVGEVLSGGVLGFTIADHDITTTNDTLTISVTGPAVFASHSLDSSNNATRTFGAGMKSLTFTATTTTGIEIGTAFTLNVTGTGAIQVTISAADAGSSATTIERYTFAAVSSCVTGTPSVANSFVKVVEYGVAATGIANNITSTEDRTTSGGYVTNYASSADKISNGGTAYIAIRVKDGTASASDVTTQGIFSASATNGAVVGWTTAQLALESSSASVAGPTSGSAQADELYVVQGTANEDKPLTTTVSVYFNGVLYGNRTITFTGKPTKISILGAYSSIGKTSTTNKYALAYEITDSAGNALTSAGAGSDGAAAFTTSASENNPVLASSGVIVDATQSVVTGISTINVESSGFAGTVDITCGATAGKAKVYLKYTYSNLTSIQSEPYDFACAGGPVNYKASLDKASYAPGEIATLTITATDSKGNPVYDVDATPAGNDLGSSTYPVSISLPQMTAVTAATNTDEFVGGKKTYKFTVGSTEGTYSGVVDLPLYNSTTYAQAAQTISYKVAAPATGAVTNAEVLAAIVKLIASINKQIRALQKSLRR